MSQEDSSEPESFIMQIRKFFIPTSVSLLQSAQTRLLQHFVRTPVTAHKAVLPSGGYLNYIEILNKRSNNASGKQSTLVLTHGFGSGLGFFFDNYDKFSAQFDRVIAVDWLGMGGSHRPDKYPTLSVFNNMMCTKMTPTVASDFFIDSLEEFRQSLGLTDFTLAGHSLGGYLSARYVLKYPSHASALVLISPVGLVDQPPKETHLPKSTRMRVLDCVWSLNYTPQDIVRIAGPKGPGMVRGVLSRRFGERWEEPATSLIADYLYHITAAPGAGEYCMNALLQPIMSSDHSGVFAREPLNKQMTDIRVPVLLMYGDHDWLRFPQAQEYVDRWNRSGADVSLALVSNAGHHLYMDNNDSFHNVINNWTRRKQLV